MSADHLDKFQSLTKEAQQLIDLAQFERAVVPLQRATELAIELFGTSHEIYAACLMRLAAAHRGLGNIEKSEELLHSALDITRSASGDVNVQHLEALNMLGVVYCDGGDYPKAEQLYRQTLDRHRKAKGLLTDEGAVLLHNLGALCHAADQPTKAVEYYEQSIQVLRQLRSTRSSLYSLTLNRLIQLLQAQGAYDKTEPWLVEAIDLAKHEKTEQRDADYPRHLLALAQLYLSRQEFDKAEALVKRYKTNLMQMFGENHPQCGLGMQHLAGLYLAAHDYRKAEQYAHHGKDLVFKAVGENDPDYICAVGNLASIYQQSAGRAVAAALYAKAISLSLNTPAKDLPRCAQVLTDLSAQCHQLGNDPLATLLLQRATEIRRDSVVAQDPKLLQSEDRLARLQRSLADRAVSQAHATKDSVSDQVFFRCLHAFLIKDYPLCLRQARSLRANTIGFELSQLILMSFARLLRADEALRFADALLEGVANRPWLEKLLRLSLGQIDGASLLEQASDDRERCRAHYYFGARLLCEGVAEAARAQFQACLNENIACLEHMLAQSDLAQLSTPSTDSSPADIEQQTAALLQQASDSHQRGFHQEALALAQLACDLVRQQLTDLHPRYAECLFSLAVLSENSGATDSAETLYPRVAEILRDSLGEDHPDYESMVQQLVERCKVPIVTNQYDVSFKRAAALLPFAIDDTVLAMLLISLQEFMDTDGFDNLTTAALAATKHYPTYHELVRVAVGAATANDAVALAQNERQRCQAYYYAAVHLATHGEQLKAKEEFDRCLAIGCDCLELTLAKAERERLSDATTRYPERDIVTHIRSQLDRALKLAQAQHPREAQRIGQQMIALAAQHFPQDSPNLANVIVHVGHVGFAARDVEQAEKLYKQAVEIHRGTNPRSDESYAAAVSSLARLYHITQRYAEAEPLLRELANVVRQYRGETHTEYAQVLDDLSGILRWGGHNDEAFALLEQVVAIRRTSLGESDPNYAESLEHLAAVAYDLKDIAHAEKLLRESTAAFCRALGENDVRFAQSIATLARLRLSLGDTVEAQALFAQAKNTVEQLVGDTHALFVLCVDAIAECHQANQDYGQALTLRQQTLEIRRKTLGERHPDYAKSLNNLALLYDAMGQYAKAEPLYRQATELLYLAEREQNPDSTER